MPPKKEKGAAAASRGRAARSKPARKRAITPEDLLKFHLVADPQISPDGRWVVFAKKHVGEKNEYVSNLWVVDTAGGEPRQFTGGDKDGGGRWSPDGSRVAFTSGREKPKSQVYVLRSDGGEATPLTKFPEGSIGEFRWSPDGKSIAVSFREQDAEWTEEAKKKREEKGLSTPARVIDDVWYRLDGDGYFNAQRHHLYIVNAETGDARKVFDKSPLGWFSFDWAPDSKRLVLAANLDKNPILKPWRDRLYVLEAKTGKLALIPNQADGTVESVAWSPDGKRIAFAGLRGREDLWSAKNLRLYVCTPEDGSAADLTGGEDFCVEAATLSDTRDAAFGASIRWSPDGKRIFLGFGWHGEGRIASIDPKGGKVQFHAEGPMEHLLGNIAGDGAMAVSAGSATRLHEIHVGRLEKGKLVLQRLTRFNDALLSELDLVKPQEHWIKSPSGTDVHLWVMKARGLKPGKRGPAVLEIHGGPHAQYGVPFFHEFQVLAANGYSVFFSNPRGSKGYGEEHCNCIRGEWGVKDWEDVQAVASFMQKQPYVDPKRMGVMGGSYGGYMTNWVIGHTDVFAGAITDRCVSNLISMAGNSDFPLVPGRYWPGNAWDKPETMWGQSPIKYFGDVKTPTLVIHSEGDLRCNVEQGEQVFTALKVRGIPTRFVRYPFSTSHGMSRSGPPDLRIHRLGQILSWWKKYLS